MNRVALHEEKISGSARLLHVNEAMNAAMRHAQNPLEVKLEVRASLQ